ncbi:MAG: asparaginase [Marinilabiliales bacterium]|nr:MAG: asparaginase [Marinilabiliales bacterium]
MHNRSTILLIYTGGTIGMELNPGTGELTPVNFENISREMPELMRFELDIKTVSFSPPVDSSEIGPEMWVRLAETVEKHYDRVDGFVILHGTDTMSYSASALSFMLENLGKPVIFTGSQLPIGMLRTDGRENLATSIEIAAAKINGAPAVPEVCVFFQNKLFRGNRTTKYNVEYFNAFRSENYPPLAEAGINIEFNFHAINYPYGDKKLKVYREMDNNVAILKIFPGITGKLLSSLFSTEGLKAVVMETYGAGNAPAGSWFISEIEKAVSRGILIVNVSQCTTGSVDMNKYINGRRLKEAGVLSGYDMTTEAAVTKVMFLLAQTSNAKELRTLINSSIRGEIK